MGYVVLWVILSLIVGAVGKDKSIGFGGAFFLSLLLSPVIGLIIALVSAKKAYACKYCGHPMGIDNEFCNNCGKNKFGKTADYYKKK